MGGSGGGGSFSPSDMSRMQEAIEARLKAIASKSTKVLFICEQMDRASLDLHLARSRVFQQDRMAVLDSTQSNKDDVQLNENTFLVAFTNDAKRTPFIDATIDKALVKKIGGVHVQAHPSAFIPSKITTYRWRSITWDELELIFK